MAECGVEYLRGSQLATSWPNQRSDLSGPLDSPPAGGTNDESTMLNSVLFPEGASEVSHGISGYMRHRLFQYETGANIPLRRNPLAMGDGGGYQQEASGMS